MAEGSHGKGEVMTNYLIGVAVVTAIAVLNGVLMYRYAKGRIERAAMAAREDLRSRMISTPAPR